VENLKCKQNFSKFSSINVFGLFLRRSIYTVYAQSINKLLESLCSIIESNPMLVIYLNDYTNENHASPAAYLFFLKLFTLLKHPLLTFQFFHPFHPAVCQD